MPNNTKLNSCVIRNNLSENVMNKSESNIIDSLKKRTFDNFLKITQNESEKIKKNLKKNYSEFQKTLIKNRENPIFPNLENCFNLILKIFTNERILNDDLKLQNFEKLILEKFLFKKYSSNLTNIEFSAKCLNKIKNIVLTRKSEDELKFVIKRSIKHMQKIFYNKIKHERKESNSLRPSALKLLKKNIFKQFYEHYFGEIALKEEIPLEKFFHFRCYEKTQSNNVPKTITKRSLCLWKKNPEFIKKLKNYIKNDLKKDFILFNKNKIRNLISSWEKCLDTNGIIQGADIIENQLIPNISKFPWTMTEVSSAIKTTLYNLK